MDLDAIRLPAAFPDHPDTRGDVADYYWEVQRFDALVGDACRVEWADGGAERNTARTWSEIESRLQHCIKPSQRPDPVNPTPDDRATVETEGNPQ